MPESTVVIERTDLEALLIGSAPLPIEEPEAGYAPAWLALHDRLRAQLNGERS